MAGAVDDRLKSVEELYVWNKRVLKIGGLWPLERNFIRFNLTYAYFLSHAIMAFADLANVFGDLTLVIANLAETTIQTMIGIKMLVLRFSGPLQKILQDLELRMRQENYSNAHEIHLYLEYNKIGRTFFRVGSLLAYGTCSLYHFKPIQQMIMAALHNETIIFTPPYRVRLFFEIPDVRSYILFYLSQTPMPYYYYCHTISICFLCTLIVHVAGELSILAYKIRCLHNDDDDVKNKREAKNADFREIAIMHQKVIKTARTIDDIFNIVLLEELAISTVLIGLVMYNALTNANFVSLFDFCFFVTYGMALLLLILVYCITGEFLLQESVNVQNACYECQWYSMPLKYRKYIIISMARAQRPLQLTAGQFYTFSLSKFSNVLKSSMAYISMLRTVE